ncbi:MAG: virulence protein RhuM/Fic/DOC family protein [Bacteroidetes bacterium]|nr:cytochrome C biogenesis protein CycH [Bacteroidota bacterium]NOG95538.1 virulence protein RhuM/Fic/DOC family protein [Bacteroidota bacterium]GIK70135.1 MAG: cytochrome c [Bacteroidota bacterium]
MKEKTAGEVVIYKAKDVKTNIEVNLKDETVWLTQKQMADLFDKGRTTINEHIQNVFKEGELEEKVVCRNFRHTTQHGAMRGKTQESNVKYYNLDVIISVGYRVKSKRGTQFRIWATNLLKQYLIKGYAINERRLKELQQTVNIISKVAGTKHLTSDEATGLLKVIADYTYALDVLDKYDLQQLEVKNTSKKEIFRISYDEAVSAIAQLKKKFKASDLFGHEKDSSFKSSLNTIYQTFEGKELYPSVEEKAANLLYFIIKNHSFSDGNKRIAAFIFIWFLERNHLLYHPDGSKRLADNALVALCLMIAESKADEKELMAKVVINLINKNN